MNNAPTKTTSTYPKGTAQVPAPGKFLHNHEEAVEYLESILGEYADVHDTLGMAYEMMAQTEDEGLVLAEEYRNFANFEEMANAYFVGAPEDHPRYEEYSNR